MSTGVGWPETLPNPLLRAVEISMVDNVVRSETDSGFYKTRRRSTKTIWIARLQFLFTIDEWKTFLSFYRDTLAHGALPFDWFHPDTGDPVTCFFLGPPSRSSTDSRKHVLVSVQLRMEE